MSYQNRAVNPGLRHSSMGSAQASSGQSPMLVARINEKRAELESLKQLRDLSGGLAGQMQTLEEKLSTLSDGTEAVAAVLSNWHNVLRAINMASMKIPRPNFLEGEKPDTEDTPTPNAGVPLPQTLVRIPIEPQSPQLEPHDESG